ncbi:DUF4190 domain-containing protein [Agromyces bauzanensis]|nr:DUF4190 domain-containing protein [Agromyces bauzanensis]
MSDREGVPPEGGTPDRSADGPDGTDADAMRSERLDRPVPGGTPTRVPPAPVPPARVPPAPGPPAEPTLRADPAVREFDVPFDTGELRSLPTGQLLVVHRPALGEASAAVEEEQQRRVYSWIAAVVGTIGALASLFVGWMLPLSIAAIVFGVLGLRREEEGRTLAFVGIGTGIAGLVFAAVWIGYYAIVFGALPR